MSSCLRMKFNLLNLTGVRGRKPKLIDIPCFFKYKSKWRLKVLTVLHCNTDYGSAFQIFITRTVKTAKIVLTPECNVLWTQCEDGCCIKSDQCRIAGNRRNSILYTKTSSNIICSDIDNQQGIVHSGKDYWRIVVHTSAVREACVLLQFTISERATWLWIVVELDCTCVVCPIKLDFSRPNLFVICHILCL